jgi:hypothetical protein
VSRGCLGPAIEQRPRAATIIGERMKTEAR